jgi:hypothetical protein
VTVVLPIGKLDPEVTTVPELFVQTGVSVPAQTSLAVTLNFTFCATEHEAALVVMVPGQWMVGGPDRMLAV